MFARVLREYGLSFDALMNLPLKRFWFLNSQIDRIRAEEDLRQIQMLASVGSQEAYKSATDYLRSQTGSVFVWETTAPTEFRVDPDSGLDPEFDREGLRTLKNRIAAGQ